MLSNLIEADSIKESFKVNKSNILIDNDARITSITTINNNN